MKRIIQLIIVLFIILGIYQFVISLFKSGHEVTYKIMDSDINFDVLERYIDNRYFFNIETDGYHFVFSNLDVFNKQKKIIYDIEYTINDNKMCIYPVYINSFNGELLCSDGNINYSYYSMKDLDFVASFYSLLNSKYNFSSVDLGEKNSIANISYYKNVFSGENLLLWDYQGVYKINEDQYTYKSVLNFDRYDNTLSFVTGNYYVSPKYSSNTLFEIPEFFIWDLKNNETYTIVFEDFVLSDYTYYLGSVDDKVYLFDKNQIFEVEIDLKKKSASIIANKSSKGKFYDGEWHERNIYDFVNSTVNFSKSDLSNFSDYVKVLENDYAYYLYDRTSMYMVYKDNLDYKVLLFKKSNISDIKVISDYIYFKYDNSIYKYSSVGLNKILEYDELRYNQSSLYDVYFK